MRGRCRHRLRACASPYFPAGRSQAVRLTREHMSAAGSWTRQNTPGSDHFIALARGAAAVRSSGPIQSMHAVTVSNATLEHTVGEAHIYMSTRHTLLVINDEIIKTPMAQTHALV